jgi:pentatricopeptide repeat protein
MYGKLGEMEEAEKVFWDAGAKKNAVTWNALITSYAAAGLCGEALGVLAQMEQCGGMVTPNIVSWSAVISGFASSGDMEQALQLFRQMQQQWLLPNVVTLATVLSACTELLALRLGQEVHGHTIKAALDRHSLVQNGLVNMYGKCGRVAAARKVFDRMKSRDLISWNSMIGSYGTHGLCDEALAMFQDLIGATVEPDSVTFVAVLSACSHTGRIAEGRRLFNQMVREHMISPTMEHYTCMVDLLGRAGLLKDASELIETMPMRPDLCVWGALLNSCGLHGDAAVAEAAIAKVLQTETVTTGNHTLITNLYAACGMWDDSKRVRMMTKEAGLRKNPGQSWIEVRNKVFAFTAGSTPLSEAEEVLRVLDDLYGEMEDEKRAMYDAIANIV